ncbi:MAG: porin family protein, partial [bacterium]|nr:porin family protein [bacterium]
ADPFIRPPLLHEYRTMICPGFAPKSNNSFIRWKYNPDRFRPIGAPVIWGIPYQAGAMVFGGFGPFTFRAAAMNSAPSSTPEQWDLDLGQEWDYSIVLHVGYHFSPELTIGLSFNRGPYSTVAINDTLPEGRDINDYPQTLWGVDMTYTRGKLAIRGEFVYDTWEVPRVRDISRDFSYYLEVSYKFFPGFFGALRYNAIHFNRLSYDSGEMDGWDYFVQRLQVGVGYRFSPRLDVRMEYMWNRTRGPDEPRDNLLALQWRLRF